MNSVPYVAVPVQSPSGHRVDEHYRVYDANAQVFFSWPSDGQADYFVSAKRAQYKADELNTFRGTSNGGKSWVVVKVSPVRS